MSRSLRFALGCAVFVVLFSLVALPSKASDAHTVNVYVDGQEKVISTKASEVGEVLEKLGIKLSDKDIVEPTEDTKIDGSGFNINVFRARPVLVVDDKEEHKVVTAHQSPQLIAKSAGVRVHEEDLYELDMVTDFVEEKYIGQKLTIDRATPVRLLFDGEKLELRTQHETVGELLDSEGVKVGEKDTVNLSRSTKLEPNMDVIVTRVGRKLVTVTEKIPHEVEVIYENSKPVGWSETLQPGEDGKRVVSYEITKHNGKEVTRKELQSVVKVKPVKEIVKRGNKNTFTGAFADALAKLRACEGGYDSWNAAGPYYGAYQFDRGTWSSVSSAPYGNATPAEQDAAARALYERRGWQPWPHCGAGLPDIYR